MKYIDSEKLIVEIERELSAHDKVDHLEAHEVGKAWNRGHRKALENILDFITSLQQEQPEVDLEKFAEKMDAWKARYNYPDNIPIKAAMAFTARMFYQYPNVARRWYDSLPKAIMD